MANEIFTEDRMQLLWGLVPQKRRSWGMFWGMGFPVSCFFLFIGGCLVKGYFTEADGSTGMLWTGIFYVLMGLGLLAGVIGTFYTVKIKKGDVPGAVTMMETASGMTRENPSSREVKNIITAIDNGGEQHLILNTKDGFFQFYGYQGQFIAEVWFAQDNQAAAREYYQLINPNVDKSETHISFYTPYGNFTPRPQDLITHEQLIKAVDILFQTGDQRRILEKMVNEKQYL